MFCFYIDIYTLLIESFHPFGVHFRYGFNAIIISCLRHFSSIPLVFFFKPEGIFLQSRRDGMIIEKQMIEDEPRRGEMIIAMTRYY
jgi:hypothetical protein